MTIARNAHLSHPRGGGARILLAVIAAIALVGLTDASEAHAQQLGSLGAPVSSPGPLEQLVDELMNLKQRCIDESRDAAGSVFIGLATIHLLWVAQQTLLRGGDVAGGVGAFVEQLIVMSLFAVVTQEGPQWGQDFIDFLRALGQRISAAPYVPQTLFDMSVKLFVMNASVLSVGPSIMYAASMCLSCLIAGILFLAQLEATVVLSAGAIVLGFGGSVWTRFLATKYFQLALSSGLRLMLLEILQGVSIKYLGDAMNVALQGGSNALEATATLVGGELFTVLLMLLLPLVFHALASGSISTSVEGTMARLPMMLAGGGMASAAMAVWRGASSSRAIAGGTGSGPEGSNAEQGATTLAESASPTTRAGMKGGPIPKGRGGNDRSSALGEGSISSHAAKATSNTAASAKGLSTGGSAHGDKPSAARSAPLPSSWRGSASSRAVRPSEAVKDRGPRAPAQADDSTARAKSEDTSLDLTQREQGGRLQGSSVGSVPDWQDLPTNSRASAATDDQGSVSPLHQANSDSDHSPASYSPGLGSMSAASVASNPSATVNLQSGGRSSEERPPHAASVASTGSATALSGAPNATGHQPRASTTAGRESMGVTSSNSFEQGASEHAPRAGEIQEQAAIISNAQPAGERSARSKSAERGRLRPSKAAHLSDAEALLDQLEGGSDR